jgi:hypothetical protein
MLESMFNKLEAPSVVRLTGPKAEIAPDKVNPAEVEIAETPPPDDVSGALLLVTSPDPESVIPEAPRMAAVGPTELPPLIETEPSVAVRAPLPT